MSLHPVTHLLAHHFCPRACSCCPSAPSCWNTQPLFRSNHGALNSGIGGMTWMGWEYIAGSCKEPITAFYTLLKNRRGFVCRLHGVLNKNSDTHPIGNTGFFCRVAFDSSIKMSWDLGPTEFQKGSHHVTKATHKSCNPSLVRPA